METTKKIEIENLARKTMDGYQLTNWSFKWSNSKTVFGLCDYEKETIFLSKVLNSVRDIEQIKNTILHEVAHALTPYNGHNDVWKKLFISMGGSGEICSKVDDKVYDVMEKTSKYVLLCPSCNAKSFLHRKPKYSTSCGKCYPKAYNKEFEFVLKQNY